MRKRKSLRGRIQNAVDRSLGWIVVTIVGFLTAVLAFLVVRSEQWLFDLKEGHCTDGWWKARRFCCPALNDPMGGFPSTGDSTCETWQTWADLLRRGRGSEATMESWAIQYASYIIIAVRPT